MTSDILQKLLDYAALRLSAPQLAEFTNALVAPDRITSNACAYWQSKAQEWLDMLEEEVGSNPRSEKAI